MVGMADQKAPRATSNRSTTPGSDTFKEYISSQWADRADSVSKPREQTAFTMEEDPALSRLVLPPGRNRVLVFTRR